MVCIIHTMIDMELITELRCQHPECKFDYADFDFTYVNAAGDQCGNKHGPVLDHVIPRHKGGPHRIENLRLVHRGCNSMWRKGLRGFTHTPETRAKLSTSVKKAHQDGKLKSIYTPERDAKIRATNIASGLWKS